MKGLWYPVPIENQRSEAHGEVIGLSSACARFCPSPSTLGSPFHLLVALCWNPKRCDIIGLKINGFRAVCQVTFVCP